MASDLPVRATLSFMPAFEDARTHAQKCDAVTVVGVHIGLHLKDKSGNLVVVRRNFTVGGRLQAGRRRVVRDIAQSSATEKS